MPLGEPHAKKRVRVDVNELQWRPVGDFAGSVDDTFGLEEVDGVHVEIQDGKVKFLAHADTKDKAHVQSKPHEPPQGSQKVKVKPDKAAQADKLQNDLTKLQWNMDGAEFPLEIKQGLASLRFWAPTPVQSHAIPLINAGQDVLVKAPTGSGKTLAFGLPILAKHIQDKSKLPDSESWPTALIIAPTRELALQIVDHVTKIAEFCHLAGGASVISLTGGLSVQKQEKLLSKRPALVVATPGRLLDILEHSAESTLAIMRQIEILVLDEVDRLVQDGHFDELQPILDKIGRGRQVNRQTLVFSATFDDALHQKLNKHKRKTQEHTLVTKLVDMLEFRTKPVFLDAAGDKARAVASDVVEGLMECGNMEKDLFLYYFLLRFPGRAIVFTNSIECVKRVGSLLTELAIPCFTLHSDMIQKQRLRNLERYKVTDKAVLIATDVVARGIDIPSVTYVVHYHMPRSADTYVHRSGRTGRAGQTGVAVSMCSPAEATSLHRMRNVLRMGPIKPLPVDYEALSELKDRLNLAKQIVQVSGKKTKKQDPLLKQAAQDLGVDSDSGSEQDTLAPSSHKLRELRAQLALKLSKAVGRRSQYITRGKNLANTLISGKSHDKFLGQEAQDALQLLLD